jgi:propionyl-CoA carboxylase alpha chain
MVTGVDLVELMIRVANGEKLPLAQKDVKLNGWALEARVYAEDPLRNFLPSTGRLVRCRPPAESRHVRVDTGIDEGSEVSMFYDPMIAKLITWGETRDAAIAHMQDALDEYYIQGLAHNISFLNAVISHPRFRSGRLSTGFIAEEYPDGFHPGDVPREDPGLLLAVAGALHRRLMERAAQLSGQLPSHERIVGADYVALTGGEQHALMVEPGPGGYRVTLDGGSREVLTDWAPGEPLLRARVDGQAVAIQVGRQGLRYRLGRRGAELDILVVTPRAADLSRFMLEKQPPDLSKFLLSPMPGLLKRLAVTPGQEVKAGEELAVVEAMKMENSLRAIEDVRIGKLLASEGQSLAVDQPIIEFE